MLFVLVARLRVYFYALHALWKWFLQGRHLCTLRPSLRFAADEGLFVLVCTQHGLFKLQSH